MIGVVYTYAGYPAAIWMLARLRPRPWMAGPITPSLSIVLAVHNGAALLLSKIEHLLSLDYPNIKEIIVVSDGSSDGTAELLAGLHRPHLVTVVLEEHGGKAVAVNAGMAKATAEVILFVDLRQEIDPGAIQQLVSNFDDAKVGCVGGEMMLREAGRDGATSAVSGAYWRYEKWIRNCESIFSSSVGLSGCFFAIRRELAEPLPAGIILDDMYQPLSAIRKGYRAVHDPSAQVFDRLPAKMDEEFQRKVRTLAGNFQLFQLAPWTLSPRNPVFFQMVSHKVMRLIVPYLLILLLTSTLVLARGSAAFAVFAALQILFWALAIAGLRLKIPILDRVANPASSLLVLKAAAVAGLYRFLFTRGPLWKTWRSNGAATRGATDDAEKPTLAKSLTTAGNERV
jgi:cellulose synthase/poly-beta-1,6-N-acetylglucosamine synthase-like glycosyltransferase